MMKTINDFFFSPYPTAQERRLQAGIAEGIAHVSRIFPSDPLPGHSVALLFSTKASLPIDQIAVYYTTDGTEPEGMQGHVVHGTLVLAEQEEIEKQASVRHWRATLPGQPENTLVRYRADGWNAQGEHWLVDAVEPVSVAPLHGRIFAYHVDCWTTPQWWYDAIVYHIFVDRFNAASDEPQLQDYRQNIITGFFGGTIRGILEKLDYIQALGANCLWLSPIFESPTAHGYNASDYFTVAKRYGTNETLRQLTGEAHRRGMRVLFDFVANHTSNEHAAFLAAMADPGSPTTTWYEFDATTSNSYRSYAGGTDMPELRTDDAGVQRYLFDAAIYWLQDLGADGLRLDYAPGPSHTFWTLFQQHVKSHVPDAVTLGEITGSLDEIATYAGRIDAFMDFPETHLFRKTFAQRDMPLTTMLAQFDTRHLPQDMSRATLLDNHDMHRFLWIADGKVERLKIAALCHFTLEGTPIVYYGTEIGLSQYDDAFKENAYARAPMLWGDQQDASLLAFYRRLLALRNAHDTLRHGTRRTLTVEVDTVNDNKSEQQEQVGGYMRVLGKQFLLVLFNNNEQKVRVRLSLGNILRHEGIEDIPDALQELLSTHEDKQVHTITIQHGLAEIELAALEAVVLA